MRSLRKTLLLAVGLVTLALLAVPGKARESANTDRTPKLTTPKPTPQPPAALELTDLRLSQTQAVPGATIMLQVTVRNIGGTALPPGTKLWFKREKPGPQEWMSSLNLPVLAPGSHVTLGKNVSLPNSAAWTPVGSIPIPPGGLSACYRATLGSLPSGVSATPSQGREACVTVTHEPSSSGPRPGIDTTPVVVRPPTPLIAARPGLPATSIAPAQHAPTRSHLALAQEMKAAGQDANAVAVVLKARGASAQETAQILKGVFNFTSAKAISATLKAAGYAADAVADALKSLGFLAREIMQALHDVFRLPAQAIATLMKGLGFGAEAIAAGLKDVFKLGAKEVAGLLRDVGFAAAKIGAALKNAFLLPAETVAKHLKALGFAVGEIAGVLQAVFTFDAQAVARQLKRLGYAVSEVAETLKNVFSLPAKQAAAVLKVAGYTAKQIARVLNNVYGLAEHAVRDILHGVGFAAGEIADAIKDLGKAIAGAADDVIEEVVDFFTDKDPVWPGNIPTDALARSVTPSSIRITWNDNAVGEDGYYVVGKRDGGHWVAHRLRPNSTSHVWTDTIPNKQYCFYVKAYKKGKGKTKASNTACVTDHRAGTWSGGAPRDLKLAPAGTGKIKLSWRDNAQGEDGYLVYGQRDDGAWREVRLVANQTEYVWLDPEGGKKHCFYVIAFSNAQGMTVPSNTVCMQRVQATPGR